MTESNLVFILLRKQPKEIHASSIFLYIENKDKSRTILVFTVAMDILILTPFFLTT